MKIVFRVDASLEMGTGHVMRCLTLAKTLIRKNIKVSFICREHNGHLIQKIKDSGIEVHVLLNDMVKTVLEKNTLQHADWLATTQDIDAEQTIEIVKKINPDWLVVDHYALDFFWENKLHKFVKKIMVIDDLGDRKHDCDLLLDQNYGSTPSKYKELVPDYCNLLLGTKYSLLRSEFAKKREESLLRRQNITSFKTVLLNMGGVDPDNYTGKILNILNNLSLKNGMVLKVVLGEQAPHIAKVKRELNKLLVKNELLIDVKNMASVMASSDLAIGASGSTTWERCCLGLPTIQVVIADNQKEIASELNKLGSIKLINDLKQLEAVLKTADDWMQGVSKISSTLTEGKGSSLVAKEML